MPRGPTTRRPRGSPARAPRSAAHRSSIQLSLDGCFVRQRPPLHRGVGWRVLRGTEVPWARPCQGPPHVPPSQFLTALTAYATIRSWACCSPLPTMGFARFPPALDACPHHRSTSSLARRPSAFVPSLSTCQAGDPLDLLAQQRVALEVLIRAGSCSARGRLTGRVHRVDALGLPSPMCTHARGRALPSVSEDTVLATGRNAAEAPFHRGEVPPVRRDDPARGLRRPGTRSR